MKPRLLYFECLKYQPANLQWMADQFDVVIRPVPEIDDREALKDCEIMLAPLGYYFDAGWMERMPSLKVIGTNTTGHPHINVEEAKSRGIEVVSLKNEHEFLDSITPTAEHAWGLIWMVTRGISDAYRAAVDGMWDRRPHGAPQMLSRMRLGIIGLGRLGSKVARYGLAAGMKVGAYDTDPEKMMDGITLHPCLESLVESSDVVTLHVPHEKCNEQMIDESVFCKFPKGSYFVNTARGELVEEAALLKALESGRLAGAALDVIAGEFSPDFPSAWPKHPLRCYAENYSNLILTPHIGGSTADAWAETELHTLKKVKEAFKP